MQPPNPESYLQLIDLARNEDLGDGDITSRATIPADQQGLGSLVFRRAGILCGIPVLEQVLHCYDEGLSLRNALNDSRYVDADTTVAEVIGSMRSLLAAERVMLNFLQRLSAVATLTGQYVKAIEGTAAKIYDTRKTTPGWRELEKYAVRCGGGCNHRHGLYDAVLIKDNHMATLGECDLYAALTAIVQKIRSANRQPDFIQVEVDTIDQLRIVLKVEQIDIILLDNMTPVQLCEAVAIRNEISASAGVQLEASGGITLENIRAIAETGIERISVGALTHSVGNLDVGLDIKCP
ncbi:MAG: carboxylating nicotinate-nucleotide diphosphorylase [Sedimentisphaerales bacterium]|nr:carboxylating nicotinate-nucleotide diphosphorylase [Sedimentisphaerales bacterium]